MSKTIMGEDLSTFIQLASGHWVGINLKGYFATSVAYPKGESPNRFKYEPFRKASRAEVKEYSALWEQYRASLPKEDYARCACGFTRIDHCNGDGPHC